MLGLCLGPLAAAASNVVTQPPPITCKLSAPTSFVNAGTKFVLEWESTNALGGQVDDRVLNPDEVTKGSKELTATSAPMTFMGHFQGPGGEGLCGLTINVPATWRNGTTKPEPPKKAGE